AGGTTALVTDGAWRSAQSVTPGWEDPNLNDSAWAVAAVSGAYGVAPWNTSVVAPDPNAVSPLTVASATTEHQVNPLGVDAARPRFSWQLASTSGQLTQAAYQVRVASSASNATALNGDVC